jgi:hypothetical protein
VDAKRWQRANALLFLNESKMSTIVYRDGIMAADTRYATEWLSPGNVQKIRRLRVGLVGLVGNPYLFDVMCEWLDNSGKRPDLKDDSAVLVIRHPSGTIEKHCHEGKIMINAPFVALGSGSMAALGALFHGATAEEAVRIAAQVDPWTGGAIQVERLDDANAC